MRRSGEKCIHVLTNFIQDSQDNETTLQVKKNMKEKVRQTGAQRVFF